MKQKTTKLMAIIALGAILVGIVGTSLIFIFSATSSSSSVPQQPTLTEEELNALIESSSQSIDVETLTGTGQ